MNRCRFIYISAFVAALLCLLSCNKEKYSSECDEPIVFSPVISGSSATTKGSMVTGTTYNYSTLGPFWVSAWDYTAQSCQFSYTKVMQFTHASGSGHTYWSTVDASDKLVEYMWKKDVTKKFFAYTNLPTPSGAAVMTNTDRDQQYLQYDVTRVTAASSQTDILLGCYYGTGLTPSQAGKSGNDWVGHFANIEFYHPLSAVIFKKGTIEGWASGDKITSIQIEGVYASGSFRAKRKNDADTGWSSLTGSANVSMTNAAGLSIGSSDIIGETFFLIPQNHATRNLTIKVTMTVGGVTYTDVSATLSTDEWMAGNYYTYTLNLSTGYAPVLSVSLADWGEIKTNADMEDGSVQGFESPAVNVWDDQDNGNINYSE